MRECHKFNLLVQMFRGVSQQLIFSLVFLLYEFSLIGKIFVNNLRPMACLVIMFQTNQIQKFFFSL